MINVKKDFGSNRAAILAAISSGGDRKLYLTAGNWDITGGLNLPSDVELTGDGMGATRLHGTSFQDNEMIRAVEDNGVPRRNISISGMTMDAGSAAQVCIALRNINHVLIEGVEGLRSNYGAFSLHGCTDFAVRRCRAVRAPSPQHRVSIRITNGNGTSIQYTKNGEVSGCEFIGGNIGMDGAFICIEGNTVSGWSYGGGVAVEQNPNCHSNVFARNKFSGGSGVDVDDTLVPAIEVWSPRSKIVDNTVENMGGVGIDAGGQDNVITGNSVYNCGRERHSPAISARWANSTYNANGSFFGGNRAWQSGNTPQGSQTYGYEEQSSQLQRIVLGTNNFRGNALGEQRILSSSTRNRNT